MAAVLNGNTAFPAVRNPGPGIAVLQRRPGKAGDTVQLRQCPCRFLHIRNFRTDFRLHCLVNLKLQLLRFFLCRQRLGLELLQLRRNVALRIHQSLLSHIIRRNGNLIGIGNFEIVAEHIIKADFQLNAGFCLFFFLQVCNILLAVFGKGAHLVQFCREAFFNILSVTDISGAVFIHGTVQKIKHRAMKADLAVQLLQNHRTGAGQKMFNFRNHAKTGFQGKQVFRGSGIRFNTGKNAFKVEDLGQHVLQIREFRHVVRQLFDAILPENDTVHIRQRPLQPPPQKPGPHGRMGVVQKFQKRSLPSTVPHIACNFQISETLLRKG